MLSSVQHLIHFADFEVDLRAGELREEGVKIRVQEQPFRVLTVLLDFAGEVVTREELRSRLWSADTFVDFDHRLAAAISKLRDALDDSAESLRFIETVGRRGYRFLLPVESLEGPADTVEASQAQASLELPAGTSRAWQATWLRAALTSGALVLLLVLGFLLLPRGRLAALAKSIQLSKGKQVSSGAVALTYAALGERNESFQWREKAYTDKSSFMTSLKYWSVFDALRGDPRFADLLRRVGLPR
jgi:DNA-binding winged helix-turn-helix (wHTH) protein